MRGERSSRCENVSEMFGSDCSDSFSLVVFHISVQVHLCCFSLTLFTQQQTFRFDREKQDFSLQSRETNSKMHKTLKQEVKKTSKDATLSGDRD